MVKSFSRSSSRYHDDLSLYWAEKLRDPYCERCSLGAFNEDLRCLTGVGPMTADIMVVGEAPGANEILPQLRTPFVGAAGQYMQKHLLERLGIDRTQLYITNVVACLKGSARVILPDKSSKRINWICKHKWKGPILAYDAVTNTLVSKKIIGWHRNPKGDRKMVRVSYIYGKGNSQGFSGVTVTEDHIVRTQRGDIPAGELQLGDCIATGTVAPGERGTQIIVGSLLGDAHCNQAGYLEECHCNVQEDYLRLKSQCLSSLGAVLSKPDSKGIPVMHTANSPYFLWLRDKWWFNGKKRIPMDMVSHLDPLGLAVWYMDDGHLLAYKDKKRGILRKNPSIELAANDFSENDVLQLQRILASNFDLQTTLRYHMGWRIRFSVSEATKLQYLIAPYIPSSMRYKLDKKFWHIPFNPSAYSPELTLTFFSPVVLTRNPAFNKQEKSVYCIEVEDTPYFVTPGGVVHNCHPPGNRELLPEEVDACKDLLVSQIEVVNPKKILALGNPALKALTGKSGIKAHRGETSPLRIKGRKDLPEIPVYGTYHPSYIMRNPKLYLLIYLDFLRFFRPEGRIITETHYEWIRDINSFKELSRRLRSAPLIAFDVETEGLDSWRGGDLICVSLSDQEGYGFVVPLEGKFSPWTSKERRYIYGVLGVLLTNPEATIIAFNSKFDLQWMWSRGITARCDWDPILAATLINEDLPHNLETTCQLFLDPHFTKPDPKNITEWTWEDIWPYSAGDADWTLRLYDTLYPKVIEEGMDRLMNHLMLPVQTKILPQLETDGMYVMEGNLQIAREECIKQIESSLAEIKEWVPPDFEPQVKGKKAREAGFNPNSTNQLADVLYNHLGLRCMFHTEKGKPSTCEEALVELKGQHPIVPAILTHRQWEKNLGTFVEKWERERDSKGFIHPHYNFATVTGRLCIAKGTNIDVARDLTTTPLQGVPIEQVKVGDWAYTYDDDLNLTLNRILWIGKTGYKRVMRVHWMGTSNRITGHVDLTPEHKVRMVDGTYTEAQHLKVNDRVLALHRDIGSYGYARLYATGVPHAIRESRAVASRFIDVTGKHVHHINHIRLDNRPENLAVMGVREHLQWEGRNQSPELRMKRIAILKELHARKVRGEISFNHPQGEACPNWLGLEKEWMESVLWSHAGKATVFRDKYGIDYETAQKYMRVHGINPKEITKMFNARGEFLSQELVSKALEISQSSNCEEAQRFLGVGWHKFRAIQEFYGYLPYNHRITRIEWLDNSVDVYDLEVETTHNLIANGICVSNSSEQPNFQQVPKFDPKVPNSDLMRKCFGAPPGFVLLKGDFSQIELRVAAFYSQDPVMLQVYQDNGDIHAMLASRITNIPLDEFMGKLQEEDKEIVDIRKRVKPISFGYLYGMFPEAFVQYAKTTYGITYTMEESTASRDLFFETFPGLLPWHQRQRNFAYKHGYVVSMIGRVRHLHNLRSSDWLARSEDERRAINAPVQGLASDFILMSVIEIDRILPRSEGWLCGLVHDELIYCLREDKAAYWLQRIKHIMEHPPLHLFTTEKFTVPLVADLKLSPCWS